MIACILLMIDHFKAEGKDLFMHTIEENTDTVKNQHKAIFIL